MKSWAPKDPNDVDKRWVSWAAALDDAETVTASDFSVVEGDVVINSESLISPVATVWLSGGTSGASCVLLNRVTTSGGRTLDQSVRIRIKDR